MRKHSEKPCANIPCRLLLTWILLYYYLKIYTTFYGLLTYKSRQFTNKKTKGYSD